MRKHGRWMKNIAGLLLLLALLSLLLPFCKFNAGDGNMTLSGIEVIKTGGKAGYTYFKEGRLSENYVIKAPYTWGNIKDSVSYINHAGGANILVFCAVAIAVPLVLCFLSMFMLFMAEGKKTMFMPTLFTLVVVAEMLLIVFGITSLRPFLKIGVYLFTILNVIALLFIISGWITVRAGTVTAEKVIPIMTVTMEIIIVHIEENAERHAAKQRKRRKPKKIKVQMVITKKKITKTVKIKRIKYQASLLRV